MIVQRVEKHLIKQNNPFYSMFCDFTHKSKNLYNHANYLVRNEFVKNDKWLRYGDMDKLLKADTDFNDYRQMPTAQSAQQILRLLEKDWKSFFAAIKDWSKYKDKYLGRPKLPGYKPKDGKHILILTNQNVKLKDKGLKSMNQYYNKMISRYREVAKRMNDSDYSNRMAALTRKRNHKIDDYMHKASRYVIEYAVSIGASTIVIGNNKEWKQESKLSKVVNQTFIGIPQKRFIEMIQYKAQDIGLNVILQEESYTSGTSFLDKEEPIKANYNKSRRVTRGLFVSNKGIKINADVNGSYQILMKVFPNAFAEGVEGVALHPVRVNVA